VGEIEVEYIKVLWMHENQNDPIVMMSELDSDRYETRKVEVFRSGLLGFADAGKSSNGTVLGEDPIPSLSEIGSDPQFVVENCDAIEFERAWLAAISGSKFGD